MQSKKLIEFQETVFNYYKQNGRHTMPWRKNIADYQIALSEIMLQQTQVTRVEPKFEKFVQELPDWADLANAPQRQVLELWQGLGYNRRALNLQRMARVVVDKYDSKLPRDSAALQDLPGIGPATTGALLVYVFNQPVVFIETNIRRVFIHHFFSNQIDVHDKDLLPIIEISLKQNALTPREWYWALMDYGTYLKTQTPNPNRKSKHHTKQSAFVGSSRELRGKIIKHLLNHRSATTATLVALASSELQKKEFYNVIASLVKEQFVEQTKSNRYTLR